MKFLYLLLFISILSLDLAAQQLGGNSTRPPSLQLRQVSGIVKDSNGQPIIGASIKLISIKDTLKTTTDDNGIFVFKEAKRATFIIIISTVGMAPVVRKYFNNDLSQKVVLDPIELSPQINQLKEVNINGTASIIYKQDTVEYKASDYHVRENATVDELLKKMEGMEVGKDGTLTYLGQEIKKAKLNGKEFAGGNVAQAIQNLPADIVEKAQIIDDYGDIAAKTGIKDSPPVKILNLTTKASKSIGTYAAVTARAGNEGLYNAKLSVIHLNANQNISFIGRLDDIINGVANVSDPMTTISPGTTQKGSPSLSYRDQWSKKLQVLGSYTYTFSNNNSVNKSYGENYSYGQNDSIKNTSSFKRQSTSESRYGMHNLSITLDYDIDKANFLQIKPSYIYSSSNSTTNSYTDYFNRFITGFEHPVVTALNDNQSKTSNYAIVASYEHIFKSKKTLSIQVNANSLNAESHGNVLTDYNYFSDSTQNQSIKDSTAHLLVKRSNKSNNYSARVNYSIGFGKFSQLELACSINRKNNNTNATSDTLLANGQFIQLHQLDNIFKYSFIETRLTFNYTYNTGKVSFAIGATALPTTLTGEKVNNNTSLNVLTPSRTDFRIIPVFRLNYSLSLTEGFSLNYYGTNAAPDFQQIQPFTDRSDPNNIIIGNPNLKPTFTNVIDADYHKYVPNSKLTFGLVINAANYKNQVVTNTLQLPQLISISPEKYKTINQTMFMNLNGAYTLGGNYNISKQLSDKKYFLSLNGMVKYGYNVAISNNVHYNITNWHYSERFGSQISVYNNNILINPYIAYDVYRTFTTLPGANPTSLKTTSLAVDGKVYISESWIINCDATKSYVFGLTNFDKNPLVINTGFEKTFLKKNNLGISFNVYDVLHQNSFIQRIVTAHGVTNTFSNTQSRYFLIGAHLILQKWSGAPTRKGKTMQRRGDGSFIND